MSKQEGPRINFKKGDVFNVESGDKILGTMQVETVNGPKIIKKIGSVVFEETEITLKPVEPAKK